MNNEEKLLYRILLGYYYIYIDNTQYKIIYPDLKIKYEAELLYEKIIEDNKFEKIYLNENEIKLYLQTNGIWISTDDKKLQDCEKFLEDCKVDLYLNYYNSKNKTQIQKNIKKATKDLETLHSKKNSFNYLTIQDHAISAKNEFMLMNSIYYNDKLVFDYKNYDTFEYHKLQLFIREILDSSIKPHNLRNLIKSDIWKSYAVASNLEKDILYINDDYRHLINLHKMYDNVKQHPECPNQEIIDDDDALDGWFIYQNRKAEKEKKKSAILDKFGNNIKNAGEVFLMTGDAHEKKDIYDLNDMTTKHNIKELMHTAQNLNDKKIDWQELPFVQRELKQKAQQQAAQGQKRN